MQDWVTIVDCILLYQSLQLAVCDFALKAHERTRCVQEQCSVFIMSEQVLEIGNSLHDALCAL